MFLLGRYSLSLETQKSHCLSRFIFDIFFIIVYIINLQEIQNLNNKSDEADLRNEELQAKILELENVLKASDNDKDSAIKRLRDELALANNELSKRGYECLSLAEERSTLQNQLKEVAQKCQELALKLEKQRSGSRSPFETDIKQVRTKAEIYDAHFRDGFCAGTVIVLRLLCV